jgi:hypothetical protein
MKGGVNKIKIVRSLISTLDNWIMLNKQQDQALQ